MRNRVHAHVCTSASGEEFPDLEEERFLIIFVGLPPSQLALLSTIIASPRVWPKTVTEVPWLVQTVS
jgi:hypothetical protein